jgi:lipopolysaccharide export system protein LptA
MLLITFPVRIHAAEGGQAEPTVITSNTLITDDSAKTALFEGSVIATKGNITIYADKMLVHYFEQKGGKRKDTEGNVRIRQIDMEGNVRIIKGERVITSSSAVYFADPEERLVFTGDPRATDGESLVTGSRMTYFTKSDRSVVENSKVFMKERSK